MGCYDLYEFKMLAALSEFCYFPNFCRYHVCNPMKQELLLFTSLTKVRYGDQNYDSMKPSMKTDYHAGTIC